MRKTFLRTVTLGFAALLLSAATLMRGGNPGPMFVDRAIGSDANDCLAATVENGHGPCLTITRALTLALGQDAEGGYLNVSVAVGSYPEPILISGNGAGSGAVSYNTIGAVVYLHGQGLETKINPSPATGCWPYHNAITLSNGATLLLGGISLSTTCPNGSGLFIQNFAYAATSGGEVAIGPAAVQLVHVEATGIFETSKGIKLTGSAIEAFGLAQLGYVEIDPGAQITCTGNWSFPQGFVLAQDASVFTVGVGASFPGCGYVSGPRFQVSGNSVINAQASNLPNFIPGNIPGYVTDGGKYIPGSPRLLPNVSGCGASASVVGGDEAGVITVGAGSVTSCVVYYAYPTVTRRFCTWTWDGFANDAPLALPAPTYQGADAFAFTTGSQTMAGAHVYYGCRYPT
jgi:hypothetical protein